MAAATTISCPNCRKTFKGKPELEGKKIRCPACNQPFVVSLGDTLKVDRGGDEERITAQAPKEKVAAGPPPAPEAPSPTPHKHADDDEDEDDPNPYGVTTLDIAARCPNCANPMESEDAVVCLFCGYNTQTRTWGRTAKTIETSTSERVWWLVPGLLSLLGVLFLIIGCLYYCLEIPYLVAGTWAAFIDHESTRMWTVIIALFMMWPLGYYAYSRLILHPTPPELEKE